MKDDDEVVGLPITMSVPSLGKFVYGLGRNGSYDASKRQDIVTVEIGGRKCGLVRPTLKRAAGGDDKIYREMQRDLHSMLQKAS